MDSEQRTRTSALWIAMVAAAAIGFALARYFVSVEPTADIHATVSKSPQTVSMSMHATSPVASVAPELPPPPDTDVPLPQAFDTLATRARHDDLHASERLLQGLVRCRTYEQTGYQPYREPDRGATRSDAEIASLRSVFEAGRAFCEGLTESQRRSEAEWLERMAESGDPEAMLCYALEPPMAHLDVLSPEWIETRRRYIANARDYAERAFERGYVAAAWALYASYADVSPDPVMRTYAIPPGPLDLARAYAFARLQAERLQSMDGLRENTAATWTDRADLLATHLTSQEREKAAAFVRAHMSSTSPPSRGLCFNAMVLP